MSMKLSEINTEDYNTMRSMISEIELKLIGVDPMKQIQFYSCIKNFIYEAWQDACNSEDTFLFCKEKKS